MIEQSRFLLGINGFMRAGKDTFGKILMDIDHEITRVSLADEVKLVFAKLFGITGETDKEIIDKVDALKNETNTRIRLVTLSPDEILYGTTVRHALRIIGIDIGRDMWDENHWINLVLQKISENTIITDVRYENEAKIIKELGGSIVRIHRDSATRAMGTHASKMYLPDSLVDFEVMNNFSIESLRRSVQQVYNEMMVKKIITTHDKMMQPNG